MFGVKYKMKPKLFLLSLLVTLALASIASLSVASASEVYLTKHPTVCYGCHTNEIQDAARGAHNISDAVNAWTYCGACHTAQGNNIWSGSSPWGQEYGKSAPAVGDYIGQQNVHQAIGCKCHTIVHVGFNLSPTKGSGIWMYYYLPSVQGGVAKPKAENLVKYITFYNGSANWYTNVTDSQGNVVSTTTTSVTLRNASGPVDPTTIVDAKVYVGWFYVNGSAPQSNTAKYLVCFNCHFLVESPSGLGMYKVVDGVVKIGIPPEALKLDPHAITEEALQRLLASKEEGFSISAPIPVATATTSILASLVLFGVVMSRRR